MNGSGWAEMCEGVDVDDGELQVVRVVKCGGDEAGVFGSVVLVRNRG